jgi:hypothetical protein
MKSDEVQERPRKLPFHHHGSGGIAATEKLDIASKIKIAQRDLRDR